MKKKIIPILLFGAMFFTSINSFAAKGEKYSNSTGTFYCCCSGGEKECDHPQCADSVCCPNGEDMME